MNKGLNVFDVIYFVIVFVCMFISLNSIEQKVTTIEKQLQQVIVMEKSRYMVSINPKDNWIMVNLDPNDFEIKEK